LGIIVNEHQHFSAWATLATRWDERAAMAGEWLSNEEAVADVGCGLMGLRQFLDPATAYIPVDIVPRTPDSIVVDLNREALPVIGSTTAAMLGVLEYIDDVPRVLRELRQFDHVVLSYNHLAIQDVLRALKLRPASVDWRKRYFHFRFRDLLRQAGFEIVRERRVRLGEALYDLRRRDRH
jgi:hypothetical protein